MENKNKIKKQLTKNSKVISFNEDKNEMKSLSLLKQSLLNLDNSVEAKSKSGRKHTSRTPNDIEKEKEVETKSRFEKSSNLKLRLRRQNYNEDLTAEEFLEKSRLKVDDQRLQKENSKIKNLIGDFFKKLMKEEQFYDVKESLIEETKTAKISPRSNLLRPIERDYFTVSPRSKLLKISRHQTKSNDIQVLDYSIKDSKDKGSNHKTHKTHKTVEDKNVVNQMNSYEKLLNVSDRDFMMIKTESNHNTDENKKSVKNKPIVYDNYLDANSVKQRRISKIKVKRAKTSNDKFKIAEKVFETPTSSFLDYNTFSNKNFYVGLNLNTLKTQMEDKVFTYQNLDRKLTHLKSNIKIEDGEEDEYSDIDIKKQTEQTTKKIQTSNMNLVPKSNNLARAGTKRIKERRDYVNMKNVYDSFSADEIDVYEVVVPTNIFLPDSKAKEYWDLICAFFIFYSVIISPYQLAFEDSDSLKLNFYFYFDVCIDFVFIIDLILNFFVAYRNEDEELVVSKTRIATNYLKTWFAFDLSSCIPFGFINFLIETFDDSTISSDSNKYRSLQKLTRLARFYRLLKWTRIIRVIKLNKMNRNNNIMKKLTRVKSSVQRLLKFFIFFLLLTHLTSCFWCFLAKMEINSGDPQNWINVNNLQDEFSTSIYIVSFYYTLTTIFTIGYGDIVPISSMERGYVLVLLLCGCMIFSFVLSSLSTIFSHIDVKTDIFNKKELLLDEMRKEYKIENALYEKIKKSIKHDYKKWNADRIKLLDSLPGYLRNQLYLKIHERQIKHLNFFVNESYDFILFVVPLLKSSKFSKEDVVISEGDLVEEMYLIVRGVISIELGYKFDSFEIGEVWTGCHFGDILMYINDQCHYNFKVKTKITELFILTKQDYAQIKLNFKEAINGILQHSYNFFIKMEKRRLIAIEYFNKNNNLGKFTNKSIYLEIFNDSGDKNIESREDLDREFQKRVFKETNDSLGFNLFMGHGEDDILKELEIMRGNPFTKLSEPIKDNPYGKLASLALRESEKMLPPIKTRSANLLVKTREINKSIAMSDNLSDVSLKKIAKKTLAFSKSKSLNSVSISSSVKKRYSKEREEYNASPLTFSKMDKRGSSKSLKLFLEDSSNIIIFKNNYEEEKPIFTKKLHSNIQTTNTNTNFNSNCNSSNGFQLNLSNDPSNPNKININVNKKGDLFVINEDNGNEDGFENSNKLLKKFSINPNDKSIIYIKNLNINYSHNNNFSVTNNGQVTSTNNTNLNVNTNNNNNNNNKDNNQVVSSYRQTFIEEESSIVSSMVSSSDDLSLKKPPKSVKEEKDNIEDLPDEISIIKRTKSNQSFINIHDVEKDELNAGDSLKARNRKFSRYTANATVQISEKSNFSILKDIAIKKSPFEKTREEKVSKTKFTRNGNKNMSMINSRIDNKRMTIIQSIGDIKNKKDFLFKLNNRIENAAFLNQNKDILQDYIKDFLGEKQGESKYKSLYLKLNKLAKNIEEIVKHDKKKNKKSK